MQSKDIKKTVEALKQSLDRCDIESSTKILEEFARRNGREFPALASLFRKQEILMRCRYQGSRNIFIEKYVNLLVAHQEGMSEKGIQCEVDHAYYSMVMSTARDQIAHEAKLVSQVLSGVDFKTGAELCYGAVVSAARSYMRSVEADEKRGFDIQAGSAFVYELSGIFDLLQIMLQELASAHRERTSVAERSVASMVQAARAARRLLELAEDWQTCTDVRQRIANGFTQVVRVEPGPTIVLNPLEMEKDFRRLVDRQRLGFRNFQRRSTEPIEKLFGPLMSIISSAVVGVLRVSDVVAEDVLRADLSEYVASHFNGIDFVMLGVFGSGVQLKRLECLWAGHLLALAAKIAVNKVRMGLNRGRMPFLIEWKVEQIAEVVSILVGAPKVVAQEAVELLVSDANARAPIDLATRPYLKIDDARVGVFTSPTMQDVFMETRRILAEGNQTSRVMGKAYETYVRDIMRDAGCVVAESSVKLRERGRELTDIDVLAIKDGVVFLIQAKYMAEPDSYHARWKCAEQVSSGVRQCLLAREFIASHPERLEGVFPGVCVPGDFVLTSFVVTPSMQFGCFGADSVFVVDDLYLDHIARVRNVESVDMATGEVVGRRPLYRGEHPTGQEIAELIARPAYYIGNENVALVADEFSVGRVSFMDFKARSVVPPSD